jgi:hypothetical protein
MNDNKKTFQCPFCESAIPMEDVNVATDLALCRSCGKTCAFSLIGGVSEISVDCLKTPPRWIKAEKDFQGEITIVYRKLSPVLFFLIPFTAFWSGFSMWGIYGQQFVKGKFDLGQSLFGIPFLLGSIVLLTIIAFLLFGKWVITLCKGEGAVFVGVGFIGWKRHFRYARDSVVSLQKTSVEINNVPQKGILVRTGEKDFVFGSLLKEEAKKYIASAIMMEIGNV